MQRPRRGEHVELRVGGEPGTLSCTRDTRYRLLRVVSVRELTSVALYRVYTVKGR